MGPEGAGISSGAASQTLSIAISPPGDPCDPNKPAALTQQMEPGAQQRVAT